MELKSVNVDCVGELVKLVFYQNHINHLNLYNQVSSTLTLTCVIMCVHRV